MSYNKFLSTAGKNTIDLNDGTADIILNNATINSLTGSKPVKTNSSKKLISSNLNISDTNNLQYELDSKFSTSTTAPAGKILISDGSNYNASVITFEDAQPSDNSILISDGSKMADSSNLKLDKSMSAVTDGEFLIGKTTGNVFEKAPYTLPTTVPNADSLLVSDGTNMVKVNKLRFNRAISTINAGEILQGHASGYFVKAPYTLPTSSLSSGKILQSDGTDMIESSYTIPSSSLSSGKILQSDGTDLIESSYTIPSSTLSSGKILQSDGTNLIESAYTLPTTSITANDILISDGTNMVDSSNLKIDRNMTAITNGQFLIGNTTGNVLEKSQYTLPTTEATDSSTSGKTILLGSTTSYSQKYNNALNPLETGNTTSGGGLYGNDDTERNAICKSIFQGSVLRLDGGTHSSIVFPSDTYLNTRYALESEIETDKQNGSLTEPVFTWYLSNDSVSSNLNVSGEVGSSYYSGQSYVPIGCTIPMVTCKTGTNWFTISCGANVNDDSPFAPVALGTSGSAEAMIRGKTLRTTDGSGDVSVPTGGTMDTARSLYLKVGTSTYRWYLEPDNDIKPISSSGHIVNVTGTLTAGSIYLCFTEYIATSDWITTIVGNPKMSAGEFILGTSGNADVAPYNLPTTAPTVKGTYMISDGTNYIKKAEGLKNLIAIDGSGTYTILADDVCRGANYFIKASSTVTEIKLEQPLSDVQTEFERIFREQYVLGYTADQNDYDRVGYEFYIYNTSSTPITTLTNADYAPLGGGSRALFVYKGYSSATYSKHIPIRQNEMVKIAVVANPSGWGLYFCVFPNNLDPCGLNKPLQYYKDTGVDGNRNITSSEICDGYHIQVGANWSTGRNIIFPIAAVILSEAVSKRGFVSEVGLTLQFPLTNINGTYAGTLVNIGGTTLTFKQSNVPVDSSVTIRIIFTNVTASSEAANVYIN